MLWRFALLVALTDPPRSVTFPSAHLFFKTTRVITIPALGMDFSRNNITRLRTPRKMPSTYLSPTPLTPTPGLTSISIVASSGLWESRRPDSIGPFTDPSIWSPVGDVYDAEPSGKRSGVSEASRLSIGFKRRGWQRILVSGRESDYWYEYLFMVYYEINM